MSDNIEPPVLMSRLMTFVFSAALVVLIVLIVTLVKMFPLDKTQVFFLTTQPKNELEIKITPFTPDADNIEIYKKAFIKEYIKARNEIIPNASIMQKKWSASEDGTVFSWSTPEVYETFKQTSMWIAYMKDVPLFEFRCPVEFYGIDPRTKDSYAVNFKYFCTNSDGQIYKKDYTIVVKLKMEDTIKWTDKMNNPLGIRIEEYRIESGDSDPLDFKWISDNNI